MIKLATITIDTESILDNLQKKLLKISSEIMFNKIRFKLFMSSFITTQKTALLDDDNPIVTVFIDADSKQMVLSTKVDEISDANKTIVKDWFVKVNNIGDLTIDYKFLFDDDTLKILTNDKIESVRYYLNQKTKEQLSKDLHKLANFDPLTDLGNRHRFNHVIETYVRQSKKDAEFSLYIAYIDLDKFKPINDTYGHEAGDVILKHISHQMLESSPVGSKCFRMGGDEFSILMPNAISADIFIENMRVTLDSIKVPVVYNDISLSVGASIGISMFDKNSESVEGSFKKADEAMYSAKKSGTDSIVFAK